MKTTYGSTTLGNLKIVQIIGYWYWSYGMRHRNGLVEDARYKVIIPDRKDWKEDFGPKHRVIWFTTIDKSGAGCCDHRSEDEYALILHLYNTLFQVNFFAIKEYVRILSMRGIENIMISIRNNSQVNLKALDGVFFSRLVADTTGTFPRVTSGNKFNLV